MIVIPKKYISDIADISPENTEYLIGVLDLIKVVISRFAKEVEGFKVITNTGKFQDSDYLHFHIIDNNRVAGECK